MLLAVIDLGSNSFKMTVAQWAPEINPRRPFRVLHKERHPVQLGASVFSGGRISDRDFREGMKALVKMQARLRDFASPILRVVATSAIRDSSNGREFVKEARVRLGIPIEVIAGAEEARLIGHGLRLEYPNVRRGLLVDIGGGSTEVACFGPGWKQPFLNSFRIGSVRLATRYFSKRKKPNLEEARRFVAQQLKALAPKDVERLVGSAGTIQSLGKILSPGKSVPLIRLSKLDAWIEANLRRSPQELARRFELTPSRARVVIPGAVVLSEILHWLGRKEIHVTGMTLRDGVMVDLVESWRASETRILKGGAAALPSRSPLRKEAADLALLKYLEGVASRFQGDRAHANHITMLALSVFDQMVAQGAHFLPEERRLLMVAAYLHDVGKIISDGGHQKHSAYILQHLRVPGFSPLDAKKTALIALYHRKDAPPKKDPLPAGIRGLHADQVRRMAAILRLADGLDEQHAQNVSSFKLRVSRKQVLIELNQVRPDPSTLGYFRDKAAYFEELFGVKVVTFIQHRRAKR